MKITKLRSGYSIKANPGEFAALRDLVSAADKKVLTGVAKSGYSRRTSNGQGEFLRVDADKSQGPKTRGAPVHNLANAGKPPEA